jgi:hypothetical protein
MRRILSIVVVTMLAAIGAACTTTSNEDVVGETTTSRRTERETTTTTSRSGTTVPDDQDTRDRSTFDSLEDCVEVAQQYLALTLAPAALAFADDEELSDFEDDVRDLREDVPPELRDDFDTVADAYRQYATALGDVLRDPLGSDAQQKVQDAQQALEAPEVQAANERIQSYFSERCPG